MRASRRKRVERPRLRDFLRAQQLERDVALEPQVAGPVDFRRTVAADPFEHLVMRDLAW